MNNYKEKPEHVQKIGSLMLPLMLVLFMSTLDQTIVVTALAKIGSILGHAESSPWIATSYLLTSAVTTLIFGKLGDMYGRKIILQTSIAVFLIGSLACALSSSMTALIIFRGFQGIGGGGLSTLVMSVVGDLVSSRERAKYQATLGLVPAIALLAGPVLGGIIVDHVSWPWIFMINIPIGIVAFGMIASQLHLPVRKSAHHVDYAGGFLAVVFTTSFLLISVFGGNEYSWSSWQIFSLSGTGLLSLFLYIFVENKAAEPITPIRLFKDAVFNISSALFFLSTAILFVGLLFIPQMLQNSYHLTASKAGACLVALLFGLILATMVTGNVITKTGRYKIFPVIGSVLCGVSLSVLACINSDFPLWQIILVLMVLGAGAGLFIQVVLLAGQNTVSPADLGVATGTLNFFKNLGGAAGGAFFGAIFAGAGISVAAKESSLYAYHMVFFAAAALTAIALMLSLMMKERPLSETTMEIAEGKLDVPEY